jgi:hypothetical protein
MDDIFRHFASIDADNRAWRALAANTFIPGIDPADLKPGALVTISPNLRVHDRSYASEVLRVVAVNSTHVQVRRTTTYGAADRPILLMQHEHHFYSAEGFETEADGAPTRQEPDASPANVLSEKQ